MCEREVKYPFDPDISVPPALLDPDPWEKKAAAKKADRLSLKEQTPANPSPLPRGLPKVAQVLSHKARTGAALTKDVLARWRTYTPKRGRPPATEYPGGTSTSHTSSHSESAQSTEAPSPAVTCSTCSTGVPPTVQHLLWECAGLQTERSRFLDPNVRAYEDWINPKSSVCAKETLLSLWDFARATGIDQRI